MRYPRFRFKVLRHLENGTMVEAERVEPEDISDVHYPSPMPESSLGPASLSRTVYFLKEQLPEGCALPGSEFLGIMASPSHYRGFERVDNWRRRGDA